MSNRGAHWLRTVGRVKDGVTIDQAQADLAHVFNDLGKAYPDTDGGRVAKALRWPKASRARPRARFGLCWARCWPFSPSVA